jgi:hypothetical protein
VFAQAVRDITARHYLEENRVFRILILTVVLTFAVCGCSKKEETAMDKAKESAGQAVDSAKDAAKYAAGDVKDAAKDAAHDVKEGTKEAVNKAADKAKGAVNK